MAVTIPAATQQIDYADLYARWERGNWSATEIDFTQDRHDWEHAFTPEQRRGALWLYSLFLHGEDAVADNLSPYIDAAPLARSGATRRHCGSSSTCWRATRVARRCRTARRSSGTSATWSRGTCNSTAS